MEKWQWPIVRDFLAEAGVASVAEKETKEWAAFGKLAPSVAETKAERELMALRVAGALRRAADYTPARDGAFCPRCWALYRLNERLAFPSEADDHVDVNCAKCGLELRIATVVP